MSIVTHQCLSKILSSLKEIVVLQPCKIEILYMYVRMRVPLFDFSAPSGSHWRCILEKKIILCEFLRLASVLQVAHIGVLNLSINFSMFVSLFYCVDCHTSVFIENPKLVEREILVL